jgi:hypothetical protein
MDANLQPLSDDEISKIRKFYSMEESKQLPGIIEEDGIYKMLRTWKNFDGIMQRFYL